MFDNFKTLNYPKALASPELFGRPLSRLFSGDVIDGLTLAPATGLNVTLAPGNALIRYGSGANASARQVSLVAPFDLAIETPDASNPRIDVLVLYIDNAVDLPGGTPSSANLDGKGVAKAKIVKGTPNANPTAPNAVAIQSSVQSGNPYVVLYEVQVDQAVNVVAQGKITDRRTMAKLPNERLDYIGGTVRFVRQDVGVTGSTVRNIPYDLLDPRSKGLTLMSDGDLRVDVSGIYLIFANCMVIDVPCALVQQIYISTDNRATFKQTGWTNRVMADALNRQFPTKVIRKYLEAGTLLRHMFDADRNTRLGGISDDPDGTSLSLTRVG